MLIKNITTSEKGNFYVLVAVSLRLLMYNVISATNRNLYDMCKQKEFRPDHIIVFADLYLPSLKRIYIKRKKEVFNFLWQKSKAKFNKRA